MRRIPRIRVNQVVIASPNMAIIRRVIRRRVAPLAKRCYLRTLKRRGPTFHGAMKIRFTVNARGHVVAAKVVRSIGDPAMDSCVAKAFRSTRFPAPQGGLVIVNYPMVFRP